MYVPSRGMMLNRYKNGIPDCNRKYRFLCSDYSSKRRKRTLFSLAICKKMSSISSCILAYVALKVGQAYSGGVKLFVKAIME